MRYYLGVSELGSAKSVCVDITVVWLSNTSGFETPNPLSDLSPP
jgi:hypothetical protein